MSSRPKRCVATVGASLLAKNVKIRCASRVNAAPMIFSRASSLLQGVGEWAGVDVDPSYNKLHHLAPLPTVASESAGLCAWMGVSKVARSLTTQ